MPELPEVEFVARSLNTLLSGRFITAAELFREKLAPETDSIQFSSMLHGTRVNFVHRRGKHVLFDLDGGKTLVTHLRMSGRFMILPVDRENPRFTHAVFYLDDETRLVFQDQRHFGLMKIVETPFLHESKELKKLAPEPFSDEFSTEYLRSALKRSRRSLKEFLLDQSKVCGLGNIYAAEAMFLARAHPAAVASKLSSRKAVALHEMIKAVLHEAIDHGSRFDVDPENMERGYFDGGSGSGWRVYDRENEPCPQCATPITRLKQAGRSSYFCRRCQRI